MALPAFALTTNPAFVIFGAENLHAQAVTGGMAGCNRQAFEVVTVTAEETFVIVFAFRRAVEAVVGIGGFDGRFTLTIDTFAIQPAAFVDIALRLLSAKFGAVSRGIRHTDLPLKATATDIALTVWSTSGIVLSIQASGKYTGLPGGCNHEHD